MVHIHITAKESGRYPGKNDLLWGYTRIWLANELADWDAPHDVTVTIRGRGLDPSKVPATWRVFKVAGAPFDHEGDLRSACRHAGVAGLHVLLQLTQPLRRPGLLRDALDALRTHPAATVMSESGGVGDGALYAWAGGDPACVFRRINPHYVHNLSRKVDIDTPEDVPPALPALWAGVLL